MKYCLFLCKSEQCSCMQTQKENIKLEIIRISRNEFFEHGFKNASMRIIARKSGVSLSNIYNYFKNKDEIMKEVLSPLLQALDKITEDHNSPKYINTDIFTSEDYQFTHTQMYVKLIMEFREELKLLLFHAHGSSFENFRDEYTDKHTAVGLEYMRKMKEKYPRINVNISGFFIHTMSSWWWSIIGEVVSHELSRSEIEQFLSDYITFGTAGWKKLMNV